MPRGYEIPRGLAHFLSNDNFWIWLSILVSQGLSSHGNQKPFKEIHPKGSPIEPVALLPEIEM